QPVSAGQKQLPTGSWANEVQISRKQAPEAILVAMAEEADRLPLLVTRVDAPEGVHVEPVVVAINKRGNELALVENPDPLWRGIDKIGIAAVQVIRSEELAEQDRCVHDEKNCAGQNGDPVAAQFPPHHSPFRRHVKALLR